MSSVSTIKQGADKDGPFDLVGFMLFILSDENWNTKLTYAMPCPGYNIGREPGARFRRKNLSFEMSFEKSFEKYFGINSKF